MLHPRAKTFGHSGTVQATLVNYLRNLVDALASDNPPDDIALLLTNALNELFNSYPPSVVCKVLCDRDGSHLCEQLFRRTECTSAHLTTMLRGLQGAAEQHHESTLSVALPRVQTNSPAVAATATTTTETAPILWEVMADIYGAHCIDAIFDQLRRLVLDCSATAQNEETLEPLTQLFEMLRTPPCAWQKVVTSKAGSHTARHLLALVADVRVTAWTGRCPRLLALITELLTRLCVDIAPALVNLIHHVSAAPFLQSLLSTLHLHPVSVPDTLRDLVPHSASSPLSSATADSSRPPTVPHSDKSDLYDALVQIILTPPSADSPPPPSASSPSPSPYVVRLMKAPIASHILETIVSTCSDGLYVELYRRFFRGHLATLCTHPVANFVVQRLIDSARHISHVSLVFAELRHELRALLTQGRAGVVLRLVEVAARQTSREPQTARLQRDVVKALVAALVTDERDPSHVRRDIASLLLHLANTPRHAFRKKKRQRTQPRNDADSSLPALGTLNNTVTSVFSPIGSQILAALFHFETTHSVFAVQSFLRLRVEEHLRLCTDPHGSHVVEHFLRSVQVTPQAKLQYITLLKGHYAQLAKDKFGSHCVERCYATAEVSKKELIVAELAQMEGDIAQSFHGRIVLKNCRVAQYKKKQETWRKKEAQNVRALQSFQEILQESTVSNPTHTQSQDELKEETTKDVIRKRKLLPSESTNEETTIEKFKRVHTNETSTDFHFPTAHNETTAMTTASPLNNATNNKTDASLSKIISAIQKTKPKTKQTESRIQ